MYLKKVFNSGLVQINVLDSNPSNLLKLIEEVQKIDGVEVSNRSKYLIDPSMFSKTCDNNELFIDINKKGCSKGLGILKLCEYLNIPLSQTISIGDSANDLSMFKQTQVDVAVANSINELKEKADVLTTSNDNDGVASFLEKHFNL